MKQQVMRTRKSAPHPRPLRGPAPSPPEQVTELQAEVAKLDANQAEATKLRQEEKAAFEKASAAFESVWKAACR